MNMDEEELMKDSEYSKEFEQVCKMIGEKYGPAARELLAKIKERKENDRLKQQQIQDVDQYLDSQIHHLQVAKEMIQNVSDKIYQGLKDKENLDKN